MNFSWSHVAGSMRIIPKNVFAEVPLTYEVSKEQLQFYNDNGYLVIKELIDFASLYSYKKRFIQICNRVVDRGAITVVKEPSLVDKQKKPEDYVNKIMDILYDDVLGTYVEHPRLLNVLSQFIGDNITAVHSMLINKPPGTERHPPHQDMYYFPFRPADKIMAAWTAIDHVDHDNGCLYVIPGSHKNTTIHEHGSVGINIQDPGQSKNKIIFHLDLNTSCLYVIPGSHMNASIHEHGSEGITKKLYHGILNEDVLAPLEKRVHLEMSPGDTVFFHPLLIHGSGPNVSKNYRKSMTCHFASSECHFLEVAGTVQDAVAKEIVQEARKRGFEITFAEVWKYRSRHVKGVRSNL